MSEQARHATATQTVRPIWVWRFLPLIAIAALGMSLLGSTLLRDWHWEHHPFHAFVEGLGAFCALMLVGMFLILRDYGRLVPPFVWVLCALVAMGVLDAFHAATHAGSLFVWLHSIATLLGGVLYAFVWLPATVASGRFAHVLAMVILPAATLLGLASIAFPAALPTMLDENGFSPLAKTINVLGGVGFLASAWHFVGRSATDESAANVVFANHCLIFGIAALLFGQSALWDFNWWLWHALRLTAYAIAIYYFFDLYRASQEELRVSEERLRKVVQNMPVILDAVDEEGNIIIWNREAERATGYSTEEIVGNPEAWLLLYPDKAYRESMLAEWKRRGDHRAWIWRTRAKDGNERLIEWSNISNLFPIPGWSSWGIGVDVTEHRELVRGLAEREAQLRLILSSTGEGIFGIDRHGRCVFANQACAKMLGYKDESYLHGKQMHGLIHHTRADGSPYPIEDCPTCRSVRRTRVEGELLWRADGSAFPADYQSHPMIQNDEVVGVVVTFSDMTERLEARAALRRERDFAESLIATAPVIILVLDPEGHIVRFNPFMAELTGYRLEEVKDKDWFNTFLPARDRAHIHSVFQDLISENQFRDNVNPILTRTGQERLVEWHNKTLKNAEGQVIGCLSIGHDITAEKEREAQLFQAQKMEVIGRLTGGIAHDFNNLLTVILGNLELIEEQLPDDGLLRGSVQDALSAAKDGASLTQRLLGFARKNQLQPVTLQLQDFLPQFEHLLGRTLSKSINLEVHCNAPIPPLYIDRVQLESALLNLAINAKDAMPNGGEIRITACVLEVGPEGRTDYPTLPSGDYVAITMRDTGNGMSATELAHATEPFFTTKATGKGSGLGLSMVYGFAQNSGGALRLTSALTEGTEVSLVLPVARHQREARTQAMPPTDLPQSTGTILLVEDDARVRKLAKQYLITAGYTVIEADTGDTALAMFQSGTAPDLLLSDIGLPGTLDGYQLACRVEQDYPSAKVLLMTGAYPDKISISEFDAGRFPLLPKPYSAAALAEAARRLLSETEEPES